MIRIIFSVICTCWLTAACCADFDGVRELIARRVPWLSSKVTLEQSGNGEGTDFFQLQATVQHLTIRANNANAAAVGLNWYLNYYCHRSMSHMGDNLAPVSPLPVIGEPLRIATTALYRYALNYCTYNYTMSFYTWKQWEHELDWMALNGINLMLVANGEEAVWRNVLKRIGYNQEEIDAFIPGPAYNAWWLMGNLQGWGGPMPASQMEGRVRLVQQMLRRMKALGIQPVMPAFFGMVPSTLKEKTNAHILPQGGWGAYTRPDILDPSDTAFTRIGGLFYEETARLYGKDIHFFSGDPFHEGGSSKGVDLEHAGKSIQQLMQQYYPASTWVLQGWQQNPKKELLSGVNKRFVLVQELFGENTNNWETRKGYEGTPFIWCIVNNFGERPGLQGKLERFAREPKRIDTTAYRAYMKGVGIMPEGIDNNPVSYDLLLETVWHPQPLDPAEWLKTYSAARYGHSDETIDQAWALFLQTVYSNPGYQEGPPENILCARPGLVQKSVSSWGNLKKGYDIKKFREGARLFAIAAPHFRNSRTYRIDLINFTRQVISNEADTVFRQLVAAFRGKDKDRFRQSTHRFLELGTLLDELLSSDAYFRLDTYQQQALDAGSTTAEKKNNLLNAMMLITYWGENNRKEDYLHEYAYKEWGGLQERFYNQRWKHYFDFLQQQLDGNTPASIDWFSWERNWVKEDGLLLKKTVSSKPLDELVRQAIQ